MGKFAGGAPKVTAPEIPKVAAAPVPVDKGPSEEEKEAAKRKRLAEKRRKGRFATILAGRRDVNEVDSPFVARPGADSTKKETLG